MPREARVKSKTGIYHVVLWGCPGLLLFEHQSDYLFFQDTIQEYAPKKGVEIYAYNMLPDHIHLLLGEVEPRNRYERTGIGEFFRCVNTVYAMHYNQERDRYGRVFPERYRSEPVENRPHFLRVLRNICREPVYRGLAAHPREYRWSSYRAIAAGRGFVENLDGIFAQMPKMELLQYLNRPGVESCMEMPVHRRGMSDEGAEELMLKISGLKQLMDFGGLDDTTKRSYLSIFYNKGIRKQQLSRLLPVAPRLLKDITVDPVLS